MIPVLILGTFLGYLGLNFTPSWLISGPIKMLSSTREYAHNFYPNQDAQTKGLLHSIHSLLATDLKSLVAWLHTDIFTLYLREILSVFTLYFVLTFIYKKVVERSWAGVATKKKAAVDKLARSLRKLLNQTYKPDPKKSELILKSHVADLLYHLRKRTQTCVDLLNFYTERCISKAYDLNLISDFLYPTALKQAEAMDEVYDSKKKDSKWVPPRLYGIPISIKDVYEIGGHDTTMGSAYKCFKPSKEDGTIINMLKDEGAIPFVMTTCPQLLLINETHNHIFGRAMNPWDKKRSPGGSSGGEAGLISLGCSPVGLGSDGGGSIRIPALCTGIYGFKSTNDRWTMRGHEKIGYGAWNIFGCGGPLGLCVDDLQRFVGCVSSQKKMEAMNFHDGNPPFDFSDEKVESEKKSIKKFGYITEFDSFPIGPTNRRAVFETVENLRRAGYEVESVKWDSVEDILKGYRVSAAMSQKTRISAIHGEKPIPEFYLINQVSTSPVWFKKIATFILKLIGQQRLASLIDGAYVEDRKEYWECMDAQFFKTWEFRNMLSEKGIDALIMPGGCFAPMEHGNSGRLALGWCYTYVLNATNFPCGAIPVTTVREGEDFYPENQHGNDFFNKFFEKNAKGSVGLPVGIQVTTQPFHDEKCIAAMKILEEVIPKEFEMPLREVKK